MSLRTVRNAKLSDLGEFNLINRLKKQIGTSASVVRGIGDDTAVMPLSSEKYLLLTTDMLLEGVHFTKKMPAAAIGYKSLAVSISDIAAMGGVAKFATVSLGVPASCSWQFVSSLYRGIRKAAKSFCVSVVGGDTIKSDKIIINIALTGEAKKNDIVYRNGAGIGDQIFVTGPLGKSLSSGWHLRFIPRVAQAKYLVKASQPTAMIDISDGLALDLGRILTESKVGAVLDEILIPRRCGASLNEALYEGEDFELLFTLPLLQAHRLKRQIKKKFSFYRIGEIVDRRKKCQLKTVDGVLKKLNIRGYTHF